jgi:gamma-glutamyltranspeptidase/glutathione hydrolase
MLPGDRPMEHFMPRFHHNKSWPRNKPVGLAGRRRSNASGALFLAGMLTVQGCGGTAGYRGELYDVDDYYGAIAGDEPRAVLVGRNLMAAGGNAADAVVGAYFAMSVTLPSTAGIGGAKCAWCTGPTRTIARTRCWISCRAPRPAGLVAVPGNVRGMAALAARYGKLRWAQLVSPAETLANQGNPIGRALAADLQLAERKVRADPALTQLFVGADGALLGEGDNLVQPELGSVLAQVRAKGPAEVHGGLVGQQLAASAQSIGAPLSIADLRAFLTQFVEPLTIKLGDQNVYVPRPPASGGVTTLQMLSALEQGDANDPVFVAETSRRLAADRAQWQGPAGEVADAPRIASADYVEGLLLAPRPGPGSARPENPFSANLVAADRDGLAVACAYTMNALFGSGRVAPGTGIILAPAPDERGFGYSALAPLIMANIHNGEFYYAASAAGGLAGAIAQASVLRSVADADASLEAAMLRPRVFNDGDPDVANYDATGDSDPGPVLRAAGIEAREGGILGKVYAVHCPKGAPADPDTCAVRADHRGNGLAVVVTQD